MRKVSILLFLFTCAFANAQDIYLDSLKAYQSRYVDQHEVVLGDDRKSFRFYPIDERYLVEASFEKANDSKWFNMETSGSIKKAFRVYGKLKFTLKDTTVTLNIYQSQNLMALTEFKDLLFLPFTDETSGDETYGAGRYIDLSTTDIKGNKVTIDFNKAYNPYCAYVTGKYNCPIPPKENQLKIYVRAGEMNFAKSH